MTPLPLAFVDCETTGLDPRRHDVWEIAVVLPPTRRHDLVEHVFQVLIRDQALADPQALRIGGFWDRYDPATALSGREAALEVQRLLAGRLLAGVSPWFDDAFLRHLLHRHDLVESWHHQLLDVRTFAAGHLLATGIDVGDPPWLSDSLSTLAGVTPPDPTRRHTALGDARWAHDWWQAMVDA